MNTKLEILYKEIPWLKTFAQKYTLDTKFREKFVRVNRFGVSDLANGFHVGKMLYVEHESESRAYAFDRHGKFLYDLSPRLTFWERFVWWSKDFFPFLELDNRTCFATALRPLRNKDEIHYILHFSNSYLTFFKIQKGKTVSLLLDEFDCKRKNEMQEKIEEAVTEVKSMLKD